MSDFDARTATPAEFEAESKRTHAECVARIDAMTDEEKAAAPDFLAPRYIERMKVWRSNTIYDAARLDVDIRNAVDMYRDNQWQSSPEHAQALDSARQRWPGRGDKQRAHLAECRAAFLADLESKANARARWIRQGNDPAVLDQAGPKPQPTAHVVNSEKEGRTSWIVVDGVRVGRARGAADAEKIVKALGG